MPEFQSILLVTTHPQDILIKNYNIDISKPGLDILILQSDKSIGIDNIKEAKKFASTPPSMSPKKLIIIPESHRLTPEAQNALLKILEEPPFYLQILLITTNLHQLLETIISRCQIITDSSSPNIIPSADDLSPLLRVHSSERLSLLPPTASKEAAVAFCLQLIQSASALLKQNPSTFASFNLDILLNCLTRLHQNSNPTLAITDAVLSLLPLSNNPATMTKLPEKINS